MHADMHGRDGISDARPLDKSGPLRIAVVGTGISGLSAAWLLAQRHDVTVFEADSRPGGHSRTVRTACADGEAAVDVGFIVYNERTYPNLTALFAHLGTPTKDSDMSFAVSLDHGAVEYSGTDLGGLLAQKRNLLRPRFWSMMNDLLRFYRNAPRDLPRLGLITLGDYLDQNKYGVAFREDHLYPMTAAIWSIPASRAADYPAASFVRFCENHGLLSVANRPIWRTVDGGSRVYVDALCKPLGDRLRVSAPVRSVERREGAVFVRADGGEEQRFDHVVIAAHADQALNMLGDASPRERRILSAFRYSANEAVLHRDPALMPRRRSVWSSWNYVGDRGAPHAQPPVTYWMNRLQGLPKATPRFVTLNAVRQPREDLVIERHSFTHPMFDSVAIAAQADLWSLQGHGGVWHCGSYFGAGFHEDGLQAGLAVAEAIGGVRRPWRVAAESGRIRIAPQRLEVESAA
jgi:predicted NAD/FAD-binding protein